MESAADGGCPTYRGCYTFFLNFVHYMPNLKSDLSTFIPILTLMYLVTHLPHVVAKSSAPSWLCLL